MTSSVLTLPAFWFESKFSEEKISCFDFCTCKLQSEVRFQMLISANQHQLSRVKMSISNLNRKQRDLNINQLLRVQLGFVNVFFLRGVALLLRGGRARDRTQGVFLLFLFLCCLVEREGGRDRDRGVCACLCVFACVSLILSCLSPCACCLSVCGWCVL